MKRNKIGGGGHTAFKLAAKRGNGVAFISISPFLRAFSLVYFTALLAKHSLLPAKHIRRSALPAQGAAIFAPLYPPAMRFFAKRSAFVYEKKKRAKKIRREIAADFLKQSFFADYEFSVSSEDSSAGGVV